MELIGEGLPVPSEGLNIYNIYNRYSDGVVCIVIFCLKRQESDEVQTLLYLCIVERKETLSSGKSEKKCQIPEQ